MRHGGRVSLLVAVALLAIGCGSQRSDSPDQVRADTTPSASPAPAGMQSGSLRGVVVDVPSEWSRNGLQCGTPTRDTLLVELTGTVTPACLISGPPQHLSVVWLGTFTRPVLDNGTLGEATIPSDAAIDSYDDTTIDGEHVKETTQRTDDGRTLRLLLFLERGVYVSAASADPSVVEAAVDSLQARDTDPTTDCIVHTHAYDDGRPGNAQSGNQIVPGTPSWAAGCVYVDGWLEGSKVVTGDALNALVAALRTAPPTTDQRAPEDTNCESVADDVPPSDSPPMALVFHEPDVGVWTVVAKTNPCTRWQSTVSAGGVTRRIDQRVMLALPSLWTSYPDPDSLDLG